MWTRRFVRDQRRRRKRRNPYAARDERANAQPNNGRTNQNRQAIPRRPRIDEAVKSSHVSLSSACCSRNCSSGTGSTAKMTRKGIAILNSATLARKAGVSVSRVSSCVSATKHAPASDALNVSIGPVFTRPGQWSGNDAHAPTITHNSPVYALPWCFGTDNTNPDRDKFALARRAKVPFGNLDACVLMEHRD